MNSKLETKSNVSSELISCDICLDEFPKSEGKMSEIDDYVVNFCGLECFDKWHKKSEQKKDSNK